MYTQYDYNDQKHVHELTGSTRIFKGCDDCHNHRFCTVTGEAKCMYFCINSSFLHTLFQKGRCGMNSKIETNPDNRPVDVYDDGNIPDVDLPSGEDVVKPTEPLPESERPRKDGPGGD